jgi:PncC family amidohydrolase
MDLEETIGQLLLAQGLTLATAESCTGGLVAHRITNVSGSSAYYLGGVVAYSNDMKEALLGVRHETLLAHGAVSEETAREMARGARQRLGADLAVSVTGIAGPTGGTAEKPVGLVYIALSARSPTDAGTGQEAPDEERFERHLWPGDRLANKELSAETALQMIATYLREWRNR